VLDASGNNNHGSAHDVPLVDGRGHKARKFDGKGHIEVPNSRSLDPSVLGWTVEVTCKADKGEGVVLARGGATNGYCLHLEEGRPVFTVNSRNRVSQIKGSEPITGAWKKLTARITADKQLVLFVDEKQVARGKLLDFIRRDPNDTMQVGADTGSLVVEGKNLPRFVGLIERVRVYSGVTSFEKP
jgi:hypothetical protein